MKLIALTKGLSAQVDDSDYESLVLFSWWAFKKRHVFYAARTIALGDGKRRNLYIHRAIMIPPDNLFVDHIDGNGLNNQRANLRVCTVGQNNRHRLSRQGERFRGVHFHKLRRRWTASISVENVSHHIGIYDTPEEAALAYDRAAKEAFGAFAVFNFQIALDHPTPAKDDEA